MRVQLVAAWGKFDYYIAVDDFLCFLMVAVYVVDGDEYLVSGITVDLNDIFYTFDCGQVSVNISKLGITKCNHWHNSKWEQFIVVSGDGLIQERNINTCEFVEFEVGGDRIEAVYKIPEWGHIIINLSKTENLVTTMTCNEILNKDKPDTLLK